MLFRPHAAADAGDALPGSSGKFYIFDKNTSNLSKFLYSGVAYGIMKLRRKADFLRTPNTPIAAFAKEGRTMKKRIPFFAALCVTACLAVTTAFAEGPAAVTAKSGLNLRQGPGTDFKVITVLASGAQVNVVTPDEGIGWAYVTYGKYAGWAASKYLKGDAVTNVQPSWSGDAVDCTVTGDANLRRGAGTDSAVLTVVPAGFTVRVDSYARGWASVAWGDTTGYISTSLLSGLPAADRTAAKTSASSAAASGRYEGAPVTCTVKSDANLRSGPATSYPVLTAIPAGFSITVKSYANGWACVSWGDTHGYMAMSLISGLPAANITSSGTKQTEAAASGSSVLNGYDYSNVYDYTYYRSQNADLRAAFGSDSAAYLAHFIRYGMAEGRQARASFNVYTYRSEHPELWEQFGDDLRAYYLWACGIPQ